MISKKIKIIILSIIFSFNLSAAPSSENDRSILLSSSNQSKYAEIFNNNCVSCHSGGVPRAPHLTTFQVMSADYILSTLNGVMSSQAEHLSEKEKQDFDNSIVEYLISEFKKDSGIDLKSDKLALQRLPLDPERLSMLGPVR